MINLMETPAIGITDISTLKSATPAEWMYPHYRVIAEVSGYDEVNHWVLLKHAEVIGSQFEEAGHM